MGLHQKESRKTSFTVKWITWYEESMRERESGEGEQGPAKDPTQATATTVTPLSGTGDCNTQQVEEESVNGSENRHEDKN